MKETRLPQNGKEGLLYGSIICLITVCVMLLVNIGTAMGDLGPDTWIAIAKSIPVIWIVAMLLEHFVMGKFADGMVARFSDASDGFNAKILFQIVFVVLGMSLSMSVIGPLFAGEEIGAIIRAFPVHWPRNFCAAFWCEICLAQPVARKVMMMCHARGKQMSDKKLEYNCH